MIKFILFIIVLVVIGFVFRTEPTLTTKIMSGISTIIAIIIGRIKAH